MKKTSRVTQKLIAERTGLSIATIDRALNNRGNVKSETLRKIQESLEELDYSANKSINLLSQREEKSIAVVVFVYPQFFWKKIEESIWKAYSELRDSGLNIEVFRISDDDAEKSAAKIREIIDSGRFDAMALPSWHDAFIDLIDHSIDTGFPVCTYNIDAPTSKRLFYVGCNYTGAGKMAAELLCKLIGEEGEVALFTDSWSSFQSMQKITGFREGLMEYPNVKLNHLLKIDRESSLDTLLPLKEKLKSVKGIYVSNAELETVAELKQLVNKKAILIGHDINANIYQYLNNRVVTATICQDPVSQGYLTVKNLFNHLLLKNEIDIRENITKLEIVMKENAKYYI